MTTDLDELMSRDPLELSSADIDSIIAYHRKQRLRKMAGEKPEKPASAKVDISSVANKLRKAAQPATIVKRRI